MADIRLDRTDDTLAAPPATGSPEFLQRSKLDSIADRGAGGMTFDEIDIVRRPTRLRVGRPHGPQLSFCGRSKEAATEIVGKADAADHRIDMIAVALGILRSFEQEDAAAFADHQSIALGVEGGTAARRGEGMQLRETHLCIEGIGTGEAAGQHGIGAVGQKFVDREFDGVKGGSTGGIEGVGSAAEAEGAGEKTGRQTGNVTVAGIDLRIFQRNVGTEELLSEGAAESVPGESGREFTRQRQVTDDDSDPLPRQSGRHAVGKSLAAAMEKEVKEGVEALQEV